jgi:serine/threonine-protein kinase
MRYFDPERLIITDDGVVKLSFKDFLLYDILYNIHSDGLTSGLGTLICSFPVSYCSPEMILIDARIDNRSDIYSVGILLFQMLTGHTPYKGQFHEIMSQQLKGKMPLNEIEDKQFRKIIKKATEKDPAKRFQSAIEFINAIDKMDENVVWYKKLYSFFGSFRKKNRLDCIIISILVTIFFCSKSDAQNTMRINYKDGSISDIPIERIDSITFVEKKEEAHEVPLFGEWF